MGLLKFSHNFFPQASGGVAGLQGLSFA